MKDGFPNIEIRPLKLIRLDCPCTIQKEGRFSQLGFCHPEPEARNALRSRCNPTTLFEEFCLAEPPKGSLPLSHGRKWYQIEFEQVTSFMRTATGDPGTWGFIFIFEGVPFFSS